MLLSQPMRQASEPRSAFATIVVQLRDVVQHEAMSTSQAFDTQEKSITPPSSFAKPPLTPPPTDEKQSTRVQRVLALFENIRAGTHNKKQAEVLFQLAEGEYDELNDWLGLKEGLFEYVKDKIRWVSFRYNKPGG